MRSRFAALSLLFLVLLGTASTAHAENSRRRSITAVEQIEGIVLRVATDSLSIRTHRGDRDVRVAATSTIIVNGRNAAISFVHIGDQIEGTVRQEADATFTAVRLVVNDDHSHVDLEGTVQSLSTNALVLRTEKRDIAIALTTQTLVFVEGHAATVKAIVAGARVQIEALRHADGTYEALVVKLNSAVVEVEGTITALSSTLVTVRTQDGRSVMVGLTPATIVRVRDRQAALQTGMRVEIKALRNSDGSLTAVRIEAQDDQHLEKIEGVVTAITSASIRVLTRAGVERTIVVPADAIIRMDDHLIPLSTLKVGDLVTVHVRRDGDTLTAVRIEIEEAKSDELSAVEGVVSSISGSMLKIHTEHGDVVVMIVSNTIIRRHDQVVPLSTLKVGDKVELKGHRNADGSFQASSIEIRDEDEKPSDQAVKFEGSIAAITTSSITVVTRNAASIAMAITSATRIGRGDHPLTVADLKVGQRVEVRATHNADGTFTALSIEVD